MWPTQRPCAAGADWRLLSNGVPDSYPQAVLARSLSDGYLTGPDHTLLRSNSPEDPHFPPMPPLLAALTTAADQQQGIGGAHVYEYQTAVDMCVAPGKSLNVVPPVMAAPGMCQTEDACMHAPSYEVPISLLPSPDVYACCPDPKIERKSPFPGRRSHTDTTRDRSLDGFEPMEGEGGSDAESGAKIDNHRYTHRLPTRTSGTARDKRSISEV